MRAFTRALHSGFHRPLSSLSLMRMQGQAQIPKAASEDVKVLNSELYMVMVKHHIKEHHLDKFIECSISDGLGSVVTEEGCRRFDVIQDSSEPEKFAFTEVYDNKEAFDVHVNSPHFLKWYQTARSIQVEDPVVSFCRVLYPVHANFDSFVPENELDAGFGSLHIRHSGVEIESEMLAEYLSYVLAEAGEASKETDCLRFDVYQNLENPNEIYTYEVYSDTLAYSRHEETSSAQARAEKADQWGVGGAGEILGRNIWPPNSWNFSSGYTY
mmetsp:Transcript_18507/g.26010  ORF Transcript_18507/g.26010 Transcript_18507/m.26010 type:complete len:270 (+) Transcript_18507:24-833(+)